MRIASEKFGTAIMKTEEVVLFVQTAVENGSDIPEAYQDMKMVDTLMHMVKLHTVVKGKIRFTSRGNVRKDSNLSDSLMAVIEGRVANAF